MGDRGNIVVDGVYLYSHWGGNGLRKLLARSLERGKDRWGDPAYLTAIIFRDMIGDDLQGASGLGISTEQQDHEHPNLVVDTDARTVSVVDVEPKKVRKRHTFEDWIERYMDLRPSKAEDTENDK